MPVQETLRRHSFHIFDLDTWKTHGSPTGEISFTNDVQIILETACSAPPNAEFSLWERGTRTTSSQTKGILMNDVHVNIC
jgi:hypothetical protein